MERQCTWCGTTVQDDVTVNDESPCLVRGEVDFDDVPVLCVKCNETAKKHFVVKL